LRVFVVLVVRVNAAWIAPAPAPFVAGVFCIANANSLSNPFCLAHLFRFASSIQFYRRPHQRIILVLLAIPLRNSAPAPSTTMPPKAVLQKEHNVYLTTSVTFDNKKDDVGRLQVYQAFSSLDEANEFCEAKADELAIMLGVEAPDPTLENYSKDGTFKMELPLQHRNRDIVVETLIMPLMGGTISHNKSVSRKSAARSTKPAKAKPQHRGTKGKKTQSSDEEEEEDNGSSDEAKDDTLSPKPTVSKPRKTIKAEAEDKDPDESAVVTEADIAAAPSGAPNCLQYGSYFVVGDHEYWSGEQIKVIISRFGGTLVKKTPLYNTDRNFCVVLGSKAPSWILRRVRQKEFQTYTPQQIIMRIRIYGRTADPSNITSEEVAKLCKQVSAKDEEDTDEEL